MKTTRLEAFSDGVMAILITIMVLELKAPHDPTPASLAGMWPTFFAYVLSFVIIAIYWVNHHYLIHLVDRVDAAILWANMNMLFWISLIPWATVYLGDLVIDWMTVNGSIGCGARRPARRGSGRKAFARTR